MKIDELVKKYYAAWAHEKGTSWTDHMRAALTELAAEYDRKQALLLDAHCERVSSLQERIRELEAERVPDDVSDSPCAEADWCPTEKSVLQRFWREAQSVPVVGEPTDAAYKWMIANGVEPLASLHKLGERLAAFLDEDQFSGCETLLLTAITAINTFVPVPAAELATLREKAAEADELQEVKAKFAF